MSSITREEMTREEMIREDQGSIDYVRPVVAEFVGTFCFIFIGAGSIVANQMTHGALLRSRTAWDSRS
jgi:hypothetical protein